MASPFGKRPSNGDDLTGAARQTPTCVFPHRESVSAANVPSPRNLADGKRGPGVPLPAPRGSPKPGTTTRASRGSAEPQRLRRSMTSFADIGVRPRTLLALEQSSITTPLPIQAEAIPVLLTGRDVVAEAPTGSGKTLAFLVPMVERLGGHRRDGGPRYGGQLSALPSAPDVVSGCPGRILDLAGQGRLNLGSIEYLVLDEADEMLDQGFAPAVERIIALTPSTGPRRRQTVLTSATMPDWVQRMVQRHLVDPAAIKVVTEGESTLEHAILHVERATKVDT